MKFDSRGYSTRKLLGLLCLFVCMAILLYGVAVQSITVTRKSGEETSEYELGGFELVAKSITDVLSSENGQVIETVTAEGEGQEAGPDCPT